MKRDTLRAVGLDGPLAAAVLFDHPYRGDVWRLEVATHGGRTFLNWRRWYRDGDTLRPTKDGATIPLERLAELHAALGAYLAANDASRPCKAA